MELPFPFIIGRDMTGSVEAIGSAVSRFAAGDRVWSNRQGFSGRQGTFAERLAIDESLLYRVPDGAEDVQVVACLQAGMTALTGLDRVELRPARRSLWEADPGMSARPSSSLPTHEGPRFLPPPERQVASSGAGRLVRRGAANYKTDDVARAAAAVAPAGFNIYWDTSGHHDFDQAVGLIGAGGRIVVMAGMTARPQFPVGPFYLKNCSLLGFAITYAGAEQYDRAAAEINRHLAAGNLRVRIDRVLPLSAAAEAHRLVESGARLEGKLVLRP